MANNKNGILYIKKYLETHTDENNPAEMWDILTYLESEGLSDSRKTVTQDIAQLIEVVSMWCETPVIVMGILSVKDNLNYRNSSHWLMLSNIMRSIIYKLPHYHMRLW